MGDFPLVELHSTSIQIIDGDRGVNYPKKTEFSEQGYCLFLDSSNLTKNGFDFSSKTFISKTVDERMGKGRLQRGDLVMNTRGTIGNIGLYSDNIPFESVRINSGMVIIRGGEDYDTRFLYLFLRSNMFFSQTKNLMSGSVQKQLPVSVIKYVKLPKVDISIQQKIAAVLSALDTKIELNQRINAELESMAKTLYDYWFVQFDFPNEKGKPYKSAGGKMVWNEELKREIPLGWEVAELGDYAQPIRGVTYKKDEIRKPSDKNAIPILRATNITNSVIDLNDMVYVPEDVVSEEQILNKFDVLITMSSGSKVHVGKNAFYYFEQKVSFGAFCSKLSVNENIRFYVNVQMQADSFKKYIANVGLGTNINNLTNKHITEYKLLIPPKDLLLQYEKTVEGFYNRIGNNMKESQTLTELRDWLLPMLMNGQVSAL